MNNDYLNKLGIKMGHRKEFLFAIKKYEKEPAVQVQLIHDKLLQNKSKKLPIKSRSKTLEFVENVGSLNFNEIVCKAVALLLALETENVRTVVAILNNLTKLWHEIDSLTSSKRIHRFSDFEHLEFHFCDTISCLFEETSEDIKAPRSIGTKNKKVGIFRPPFDNLSEALLNATIIIVPTETIEYESLKLY